MPKPALPKNLYRSYRADVKFNEAEWKKLVEMAENENMTVASFIRLLIQKWYRIQSTPNKKGELPTLI
jgi:predicted DNA-binding ribbon-helix-helix protein